VPTKNDLIDDLQNELEGGEDSDLDELFGAWVDETYFRLSTMLDTVDDDVLEFSLQVDDPELADVDLPDGVRQVSRVQLVGSPNTNLPFVDRRELLDLQYDLTTRGTPRWWTWGAYNLTDNVRTIRVVPYPDADDVPIELDLVGRRDPQALVGSAQIPLPPELIPVLKDGVRAHWHQAENLFEQARQFWSLYELGLDRAWRRLLKEPQPRTPTDPDADLRLIGRTRGPVLRVPPYIIE